MQDWLSQSPFRMELNVGDNTAFLERRQKSKNERTLNMFTPGLGCKVALLLPYS